MSSPGDEPELHPVAKTLQCRSFPAVMCLYYLAINQRIFGDVDTP